VNLVRTVLEALDELYRLLERVYGPKQL